jgi:hypothetical protein
MTLLEDPEEFVGNHRPHGTLTAETGALTPNGYRLRSRVRVRRDVRAMDHANGSGDGPRRAGSHELTQVKHDPDRESRRRLLYAALGFCQVDEYPAMPKVTAFKQWSRRRNRM